MNTQPMIQGDEARRTERTDPGMQMDDDRDERVEDQTERAVGAGDSAESRTTAETPYLAEQDSGVANERWQRIQATFVDDPRKSVSEAHQLVGELTQRIVDAFAKERDDLEHQWSKGDSVSTEDLRVCLQRYRAFFSRLLPSVNKLQTD